jgi:hypothetical protein
VLGKRYLRITSVIHDPTSLDDVDQIGNLRAIAENIDPDT